MMNQRVALICLLVASSAALASCSTTKAPNERGDLTKKGPCAASWNLRYEQLVGHSCYPERVVRAAKAGCKAGDKTSCKVARAVSRFNRTTHLDLADDALAVAAAAGCKAGSADGCALQGVWLSEQKASADKAAKILARGCKLGSQASCYEASRLRDDKSAGHASSCDMGNPAPCRRKACRHGDAVSCRILGAFAEDGEHLEPNVGEAVDYYERACMLGDSVGCGELGRFYAQGRVVPRQSGVARTLFEWGCGPDNTTACVDAARMLAGGLGGEREPKHARRLYASACDARDGAACRELASLYEQNRSFQVGKGERTSLFEKACEFGDGQACGRLAEMQLERKPLQDEDVDRAVKFYHRACDAGFGDGCEAGANRFYNGEGVEVDERVAAELAAKSCEIGTASHCWSAANSYRDGYGVAADAERATALITRAIELYKADCGEDRWRACHNASHAIAHGFPKEKKLEEAQKYLDKACEEGAEDACREIAMQRVTGEIYPVDRKRGLETMQKQCDEGDTFVCQRLADELSFGARSANELARAQSLRQRGCFWRQNDRACVQLGLHYQRGHGVERNLDTAYRHASRACDEDKQEGCRGAAVALLRRSPKPEEEGKERDKEEKSMPEVLQQHCVFDGDDELCPVLARMYESGYQLPKEPYRAISLYERVCDADSGFSSEACSRAELLRVAQKASKQAEQTSDKLEEACKGGDATGCVLLARHHEFGSFDKDRFRAAMPHYRKACELGNEDACTVYIALAYEEGEPWGKDLFEELEWACQKGTARMCHQWGKFMGSHRWDRAVRLNQAACAKGHEKACRFLKINLEPLPSR